MFCRRDPPPATNYHHHAHVSWLARHCLRVGDDHQPDLVRRHRHVRVRRRLVSLGDVGGGEGGGGGPLVVSRS